MGPHLRRAHPYRPRRGRRTKPETQKQLLHDLEHKISAEVSTFILWIKQGNVQQMETAKLKVKSDFLKHSEEMQKIAQSLGERYVHAVKNFLASIDQIIHSEPRFVDEAKISHCYQMTQVLEKEISAA